MGEGERAAVSKTEGHRLYLSLSTNISYVESYA